MFDIEVGDDTILIFEYYTASGTDDPAIISEAEEIVRSIVLDLKDEDICVLVSCDNIRSGRDCKINCIGFKR